MMHVGWRACGEDNFVSQFSPSTFVGPWEKMYVVIGLYVMSSSLGLYGMLS